jgi:hypothetical protein
MLRIYFKERKEYINLLPFEYLRGYIRRLRREFWAAIGGITVSICLLIIGISVKFDLNIGIGFLEGIEPLIFLFILGWTTYFISKWYEEREGKKDLKNIKYLQELLWAAKKKRDWKSCIIIQEQIEKVLHFPGKYTETLYKLYELKKNVSDEDFYQVKRDEIIDQFIRNAG